MDYSVDILKSDLSPQFKNYWYDIATELSHKLNAVIQILVTSHDYMIIIKITFEKFKHTLTFTFPFDFNYNHNEDIISLILDNIKREFYVEIFKS